MMRRIVRESSITRARTVVSFENRVGFCRGEKNGVDRDPDSPFAQNDEPKASIDTCPKNEVE